MTVVPAIHPLRRLLAPGIDAVRTLWLPFVLVQLLGLATVVCYFHVPAVTAVCDRAADFKSRQGLWFAVVAMAIASGIVPEFFKTITGVERRWDRERLSKVGHNLVLFGISGITVDLLYSGLGTWLGDSRAVGVVLAKVLIDQFGYTPFFAVPIISLSYTLRSSGYSVGHTLRQLNLGWYGREVAPVLVVCWAYWIPMVTLAYVLPPKLTFVYGTIASAAASTLLIAIASREREPHPPHVEAAATP